MILDETKRSLFNVLHITSRADVGGGPKHLYLLAKGCLSLIKNNSNTNINSSIAKVYIASPSEKPYGPLFKNISTEHVEIPRRRFSISKLFYLIWFCKKNKISIVHSHGFGAGLYSRPLFLGGLKVIHTFHGIHLEKGFLGQIKLLINKFLIAFTSKCICVSEDEKEVACKLLNLNPDKGVVIYNGLDLSTILEVKDLNKKDIRKEVLSNVRKPKEKRIIIGSLSRLCYPKGLDVLLDLVSQYKCSKDTPPFYLYIAGDGEDRHKLENQRNKLNLKEDVIFLGNIDKPYLFLKSLDLFVSTARCEGMPYSVLEAIALDIPVLLSDVTGHRIFGKRNLFDLNNFQSFKECLKKKFTLNGKDIELQKELLEKYSFKQMINQTLNLYKTIANG